LVADNPKSKKEENESNNEIGGFLPARHQRQRINRTLFDVVQRSTMRPFLKELGKEEQC
jgi:hypothetical protein